MKRQYDTEAEVTAIAEQALIEARDAKSASEIAQEVIGAALEGVPEWDNGAGYWWHVAADAIRTLRESVCRH